MYCIPDIMAKDNERPEYTHATGIPAKGTQLKAFPESNYPYNI